MELNAEERLKALLEAGGVLCSEVEYEMMPVFASAEESIAFGRLSAEERKAYMKKYLEDHGTEGGWSEYQPKDLVKIRMPDDSMYPLIFPGDELTIAFREDPEDGDLAAVTIPGTDQPFTIRQITYGEFDLWLIPRNKEWAVECCDPEQAEILGKCAPFRRSSEFEVIS